MYALDARANKLEMPCTEPEPKPESELKPDFRPMLDSSHVLTANVNERLAKMQLSSLTVEVRQPNGIVSRRTWTSRIN